MKWVIRLLVLFVVVPAAEMFLLGRLSAHIGLAGVLLLILATGVVGAGVARWQGLKAIQRVREEVRRGRVPTQSLLEGVAVLLGCALLVTPGVLTDAFGLLLFVPAVRRRIARWVARRIRLHIEQAVSAGTIEVHFGARPLDDDSFHIR